MAQILLKLGLIKTTPSKIRKWSKEKKLLLLKYAAVKGDFRSRKEVAKYITIFNYQESESILLTLLHDKVYVVAIAAIESLEKYKLPQNIQEEIQAVLEKWKENELKMKENWNNLDSDFHGLYIDKSRMKRLKELKYWMAKFKGSMSIS